MASLGHNELMKTVVSLSYTINKSVSTYDDEWPGNFKNKGFVSQIILLDVYHNHPSSVQEM